MDKIELLERHYNSCISQEDRLYFFRSMADYIDFADNIKEFSGILDNLALQSKENHEKIQTLGENLTAKCDKIKKDVESYLMENTLEEVSVLNDIKRYEAHHRKDIVSSQPLPLVLFECLEDILKSLDKFSEHTIFSGKFLILTPSDGRVPPVLHLKPFQEYMEYSHAYTELKNEQDTTLWGQLEQILILYRVIQEGKKTQRELLNAHKDSRTTVNFWNIMNYSVLFSEWRSIEEKGYINLVFFDIRKIKPWISRLHNHILTQNFLNSPPTAKEVTFTDIKVQFHPVDGIAEYKGTNFSFGVGTKCCVLLDFLFGAKNTPLELRILQERCNSKIRIDQHRFKQNKDVSDTIGYIRKKLKVKKGEYFPIFKRGDYFIWEEK